MDISSIKAELKFSILLKRPKLLQKIKYLKIAIWVSFNSGLYISALDNCK